MHRARGFRRLGVAARPRCDFFLDRRMRCAPSKLSHEPVLRSYHGDGSLVNSQTAAGGWWLEDQVGRITSVVGCGESRRENLGRCDRSLPTFQSIRRDITLGGRQLAIWPSAASSGWLHTLRYPVLASGSAPRGFGAQPQNLCGLSRSIVTVSGLHDHRGWDTCLDLLHDRRVYVGIRAWRCDGDDECVAGAAFCAVEVGAHSPPADYWVDRDVFSLG